MTPEQRFWGRVDFNGYPRYEARCWLWTGHLMGIGYGQFKLNGKVQYAHRVAYTLANGPIPDGLHIDHLCRNRGCVRPSHLEAVTQRENILRGDSPAAKRAKFTECPQGHAYTPENTITRKTGWRECRTCANKRRRDLYKHEGYPKPVLEFEKVKHDRT